MKDSYITKTTHSMGGRTQSRSRLGAKLYSSARDSAAHGFFRELYANSTTMRSLCSPKPSFCLSRSSTSGETRALAAAPSEAAWLRVHDRPGSPCLQRLDARERFLGPRPDDRCDCAAACRFGHRWSCGLLVGLQRLPSRANRHDSALRQ